MDHVCAILWSGRRNHNHHSNHHSCFGWDAYDNDQAYLTSINILHYRVILCGWLQCNMYCISISDWKLALTHGLLVLVDFKGKTISTHSSYGPFDKDMSKMRVTKGVSAMNCIINVVGEVEGDEPCFVADIVMKQSNIRNPPSYRYVMWRCYCLESYSIMSDSRLNAWVVSDPGFGCKFMLHCNICLTVNSHIRLKNYESWYGQFGQNLRENKNCSRCSHPYFIIS